MIYSGNIMVRGPENEVPITQGDQREAIMNAYAKLPPEEKAVLKRIIHKVTDYRRNFGEVSALEVLGAWGIRMSLLSETGSSTSPNTPPVAK